jgi:hypothetical protein
VSATTGIYTDTLYALAADLQTPAEEASLLEIVTDWPASYAALIELDRSLGGPGFSNIDHENRGLYAIEDRDIFRPLQYVSTYFKMSADGSLAPWLTRTLVQMSGILLESLIKRIAGVDRLPLGAALAKPLAKRKINGENWDQLQQFSRIYNAAKHHVNQPKDTHLFSMEDAILAYYVARKLAADLYPLATLSTDIEIFDETAG